jgi:phosphopentomutase
VDGHTADLAVLVGRLTAAEGAEMSARMTGRWGRSRIAHAGADTYLGLQEMMGTIPVSATRAMARFIVDYCGVSD